MPSTSAPSDAPVFAAKYYDGRRALAHKVRVQFNGPVLMIVDDNGQVLDSWTYEELEFGDRAGDVVRIAKKDSEARLVFTDPQAFDVIRTHAPNIMTRQKRVRRGMLLAVASTVAVIVGIYLAIPLLTDAVVAVIPSSVEARLGEGSAKTIINLVGKNEDEAVCRSAAGQPALDKMTALLAQHTHGVFAYQVKVLNIDMANALALPGGHIFLFKGLLEEAESAEEVAGVLAHEMAHVDLRHSLHSLIQQSGLQVLADMMFGGGALGGVSSFVMGASYTREAEAAADDQAVRTLREAGISTHGFAAFFERLHAREKKTGFALPDFMSTHPPSDSRAKLAQTTLPSRTQVLSDGEWDSLQKICN